jgi:hypothetical protein
MFRRIVAPAAFAAALLIASGCSEGPKSIPPKVENTKLPSAAGSNGSKSPAKTPTSTGKAD